MNNSTSKVSTIATLVMILFALALFFNVWWKCAKIGPRQIEYMRLTETLILQHEDFKEDMRFVKRYPVWLPYTPAEYEELSRLEP